MNALPAIQNQLDLQVVINNPLVHQIVTTLNLKDPLSNEFIYEMLFLCQLFDQKQQDYGPGNIAKFMDKGVIVRLSDKVERLVNLYKTDTKPRNESIDDSFRDAAVYSIIALLCRKGVWPK